MTSAGCLQEAEGGEAGGRDTCPSHTLPVEKKHTHKKSHFMVLKDTLL